MKLPMQSLAFPAETAAVEKWRVLLLMWQAQAILMEFLVLHLQMGWQAVAKRLGVHTH